MIWIVIFVDGIVHVCYHKTIMEGVFMKKLLSISICLLICLTSICVFGACKQKDQSLSEAEALASVTTAVQNFQTETTIEATADMGLVGSMIFAKNEEGSYTNMWGAEIWTRTENDVVYQYSVYSMEFNGEEVTTYTKSVDDGEDSFFDMSDVELTEESTFVRGSVAGARKTIIFKFIEEGEVCFAIYVIENDKIISFSIASEMGVTQMAMTFKYGADANIPELPTVDAEGNEIIWD